MSKDIFEKEKIKLTPETGFNLIGIDYFEDAGNQLYLVAHFEMYQDALNAKKERKNQENILYYTKVKIMNLSVDKLKKINFTKNYIINKNVKFKD